MMMEDNLGHIVYSVNVLEFVTVAGEYSNFIERINETEKVDFLMKAQKLLPLLYLKGSLIPKLDNVYDEIVEKFVTEESWSYYQSLIAQKLGEIDEYLEVFDPDISYSEGPLTARISENLADIYQDIKDFISVYRIGTTEIMNDALWECKQNFEQYWGQKLLNASRAIHLLIYNHDDLKNEDNKDKLLDKNEETKNSNYN